ncbi:hypothetical protein [Amaricoccus macauensis]|uniref:hypothetical protein n=1 Tax=Amaricoccus macauensis TaxID=57001 RepID=UPI003C7C0825
MIPAHQISRLATIICIVGFVAMPLSWVPIISTGGMVLEVPNVVSVLFLAILPLAVLNSRRMWRINLTFGLMFLWSLVYASAIIVHHTPQGFAYLWLQVMQAAFGWTLALAIAHSDIRLSRAALWGIGSIALALLASSLLTNVNLIAVFTDYLISGNRTRFIYQGMRTVFNAFTFQLSDFGYVASQINALANTVALYAIMVFMNDGENGTSPVLKAVALFCLAVAFVLFSASANLVIVFFLICLGLRATTRAPQFVRAIFPLLVVALMILAFGPVTEFLGGNLDADTDSRGARLGQYNYAFGVISENLWGGIGYSEFGGFTVHNWALFSWAAAGYAAFMIVCLIYLVLMLSTVQYAAVIRKSTDVILAVLLLMVIRTAVGGGGGIPTGSAIVASAVIVGLMERHLRMARQPSPEPEPDHDPVAVPAPGKGYSVPA